ncbi:hypothetical protein ACTFIR_003624 [Dictyostelium discoideum]
MASYLNRSSEQENIPLLKNRKIYSLNSLIRKYPVNGIQDDDNNQQTNNGEGNLNKCLTVFDIISYGIGSTVGAGVFVSIGIAISSYAGPGTLLSFLFSAIACLISAFCYSEFSARIPASGSAYTFAYVSLGEYMGWFVGWNLTLEYAISASAVARGWVGYFSVIFSIFGAKTPQFIQGYQINDWININPIAPLIIVFCTIILVFGIKDSARFNMIITCINILTILFFIVLGSIYVKVENWTPFLPFGFDGVFNACSVVFFSYVGFDSVTTLAGEVKNPKRDLPIGVIGSLVIATSLYIGVTLVLSGMVNFREVSQGSPLSDAFIHNGLDMKWAAMIIAFGTLTSLTASTLCCLIGQPRIYLQMAKDGLFFKKFGELNKKQVPVFGILFTCGFASLLAIVLDLDNLTNMISIGTLLAFTCVCAGVVVMRYRNEDGSENGPIPSTLVLFVLFVVACVFGAASYNGWKIWIQIVLAVIQLALIILLCFKKQTLDKSTCNYFLCPLVPIIPCLGIIINTYFIMHLDSASFIRMAIWTVVGTIVYFVYSIRNSKLNNINNNNNNNNSFIN